MFFRKRKQIYYMCKAFESGRMVPNTKRGGEKEFMYIKAANREMVIQVRKPLLFFFNFSHAYLQAYVFQLLVVLLVLYRIIFLHKELREYKKQLAGNATVLTRGPPLPFVSYIPFPHEDGFAYYAASFFQTFGTWLFGVYIGAIDVILGGFLIHSKAQLLILRNYISLFAEKSQEMFVSKNDLQVMKTLHTHAYQVEKSQLPKEEIARVIDEYKAQKKSPGKIVKMPQAMLKYAKKIVREYAIHHLEVIKLCKDLEEEFSILILLQFIASSGMICFILYHLYDVCC